MDVTDKTWEEVFTSLVESGELGRLIAVACFFAFLGWLFTRLYFTKVRYYKLENELSIAKQDLASKQTELDNVQVQLQRVQKKCEELREELKSYRDRKYVDNAPKPDKRDQALNKFFK